MTDDPKKPRHPTPREYAEHRAEKPLPGDDIQPEQPSAAQQRRVLGAGATQVLRDFAAAAQAKGPQPSRTGKVPIPDWQTNRTGIPVSRFEEDE